MGLIRYRNNCDDYLSFCVTDGTPGGFCSVSVPCKDPDYDCTDNICKCNTGYDMHGICIEGNLQLIHKTFTNETLLLISNEKTSMHCAYTLVFWPHLQLLSSRSKFLVNSYGLNMCHEMFLISKICVC